MGVTSQLLELYRVDQQLRGLTGRLKTAESYLAEQDKLLGAIKAKHDAMTAQLKQLEAAAHNDENEAKGLDQKIEKQRERMNNAQTSKEHSALTTEIANLKADKGLIEERALTSMTKVQEFRTQLVTLDTEKAEREKVREIAKRDRDERQKEIQGRLDELNAERGVKSQGIPADAMKHYTQRLDSGAEEVMAPLQEEDRRNMEYTCGGCYTMLPIELVSVLLKRGDLTRCPSCKVILYMEASLKDDISSSNEKKKTGATGKGSGKGSKKKTVPSDE